MRTSRVDMRHVWVVITVTWLLIWIRGGWGDAPWVVGLWAAFALVASILTSAPAIQKIDRALSRVPASLAVRNGVAVVGLGLTLLYTGSLLVAAGLGALVLLLALSFLLPLLTALLATHGAIAFGIASATCITVSFRLAEVALPIDVPLNLKTQVVRWSIAAGVSLLASIPIHRARKAKPATGAPSGASSR